MSLQNRIAKIVDQYPGQTAIEYKDTRTTYHELDHYANRICHFLTETYAGENKNILIYLDKSPELIGAILGIMKFSGVFVPLDTGYSSRVSIYLEEVAAEWMITTSTYLKDLNTICKKTDQKINVLVLDSLSQDQIKFSNLSIFCLDESYSGKFKPNQLEKNPHCYIYFTSGSTGRPKGILGRHKSLEHFIQWEIDAFGIGQNDRFSQLTSPSFDPFLRDIFVPLCSGGTICIPENLQFQYLIKWIDKQKISMMHMTPAYFRNLIEQFNDPAIFTDLRYIILAGEILRGRDIEKFFNLFDERINLINLYGPTETTLAKLFYQVRQEDVQKSVIPVGKPISVTEVIVLDNFKQPCEIGKVGEVYIRTPFISAGYYNQPEMTQEVFIQNPFNKNPKDIIYKTGDLGKKLPDRNLVLLGRMDHQVKIRGMRIEPGEIESKLLQYADINEAVVIPKGDGQDTFLIAYIVSKCDVLEAELKKYLQEYLPSYMIPTYIIPLEKMPLNKNGKIDRKALAKQKIEKKVTYVAPENELEEKLVKIWEAIFEVDRVGILDDFLELGGHSLKAIALSASIYNEFNIEFAIRDIYNYPNVQLQAQIIQSILKHRVKKDDDNQFLLLNKKLEKNLFCFPPIIGYGIVYKSLAELITTHSVYGFNYIDIGDPVEKYVELITNIQPEGPYILLGYSAGGGLAYDVGLKLIEKGYQVSDLIMLDSLRNVENKDISDQDLERVVDQLLDDVKDQEIKELLKIESVNDRVKRKIYKYHKYKNEVLNLDPIATNIHFISSENESRAEIWKLATQREYFIYRGSGGHTEMIEGQNLKKNVQIINTILS